MAFKSGWFKRFVFSYLRIYVILFALVFAGVYFYQEKLIFIPQTLPKNFTFNFRRDFKDRFLDFEGNKINFLVFPVAEPRGVILYFHGNGGSLEGWGWAAADLAEKTGFEVRILDYPGYGKSEGQVRSEKQLHELAEIFWTTAERESKPGTKMIILGRSIGTGIAARLASEHEAAGLVLESPYFSLSDLVREKIGWLPPGLLRYSLRSDLWLPKVRSPILILHGTNDELIPVAHGERLSHLTRRSQFIAVRGGGHNDLSEYPEYWSALLRWLPR